MKVSFQLGGLPVPKGRPRFTKYGKPYTPKPTLEYEDRVAEQYRIAAALAGVSQTSKPVLLTLTARFPVPKSAKRKRIPDKITDGMPHAARPDLDNILKAVLDGLNQVAWADDSQVYGIVSKKVYSDYPGIGVTLEWDEA